MYKIDLHTHSVASPDGGITKEQYQKAFDEGLLDCIAVTDHNRIDYAALLQQELGDRIIVGEEIMTTQGEIIGLYLEGPIASGLTPQETIKQIKAQGGIVYVPHPFETVRKGLHPAVLEEIADQIDLIEVCNGRAFMQNRSQQAFVWAKLNHVTGVSSSDAHGFKGLGKTYTQLDALPTPETILKLANTATLRTDRPSLRALFYPKYHRLRRKIRRHA